MNLYRDALSFVANNSLNMPDPETSPGKFIAWAEDICQLLAYIYERNYDDVTKNLKELVIDDYES